MASMCICFFALIRHTLSPRYADADYAFAMERFSLSAYMLDAFIADAAMIRR